MSITKQHLTDLKDVSDILKDMAGELDIDTQVCNSCGRDSWSDLREGRLGSEVGAMLRKTNKCLGIVKDALAQREVDALVGPSTDPQRVRTHENP